MTWCQKLTIKTRQRGLKIKMRLLWTKLLFFNRHICAINTAKYKDSSSWVFYISYQTYPVRALRTSNITTRLHCYLTIAAAFHKQTGLLERRNRQLEEKSTLFCQIEIIKLLAFCCNVNVKHIQHTCNIFYFSQSVHKWSIYPVTSFSMFNICDLLLEDWLFLFQSVFKVYNETKRADVLDMKITTNCLCSHLLFF